MRKVQSNALEFGIKEEENEKNSKKVNKEQ